MDANTENSYLGAAKRDVVAGLQFAFDLPYKGYFNVAPLGVLGVLQPQRLHPVRRGLAAPAIPGVTCLSDGNTSYKPTWAVETNYYMDLGFLPENMQLLLDQRPRRLVRQEGHGHPAASGAFRRNRCLHRTKVEFNSEPIRLTFDASKAVWGPKYSHFVDVWVAYRYWQNKFGLDHNALSAACLHDRRRTRASSACTESSLYSGITVKF